MNKRKSARRPIQTGAGQYGRRDFVAIDPDDEVEQPIAAGRRQQRNSYLRRDMKAKKR